MSNQITKISGLAGPKKSELMEILLGYAIAVAINIFWFRDNMGFYGFKFHPYWIIIIAIASRYGFRGGVIAGVAGGVIMLALIKIGHPELEIKQFMGYKYFGTPLFFLAVGTFLGELREIQKSKFEDLENRHNDLKNSFSDLSRNYEAINLSKQELDTRIIGQEQTISTLYESAHALKSLKEGDIYPAVLRLLKEFVAVEECSIYKASENRLKMIVNLGWQEDNNRPLEVGFDDEFMGKAFSSGELVSINDVLTTNKSQTFSDLNLIFSVPIIDSRKEVLGVLNVEKIPFIKFNPQSIKMVSLLANWCGSAIENARIYKETKDKNIADDITGAYTYDYLCNRLDEEFQKARRYKFTFSILVLRIMEYNNIPENKMLEILPVFNTIFKGTVRNTDLLFVGKDPGIFIYLFPFTPAKGVKIVKDKLINAINEFKFRPYDDENKMLGVRAGIAEYNDKVETFTELIQMSTEDMYANKN